MQSISLGIIGVSSIIMTIVILWHNKRRHKRHFKRKKEPIFREILSTVENFEEDILHEKQPLASQTSKPKPVASPEDLITLQVMAAPERPYTGYELLQALLSTGLRFGGMDIFHRYEEPNGRGNILFSLASATEPGTFELSKMGGFSCRGLTLFMQLPGQKNPMKCFDMMLETAKQLLDDLGGVIWSVKRRPLTNPDIEQIREKIRHYEETNQQLSDLFKGTANISDIIA